MKKEKQNKTDIAEVAWWVQRNSWWYSPSTYVCLENFDIFTTSDHHNKCYKIYKKQS